MEPSGPLAVIRLCRAAKGMGQAGIRPADLHQQIMGPAERQQPALHGLLSLLDTSRGSKALRRDGADSRKRILDTMVQFTQDEFLQLVGGLAFLGIDAS